MTEKAVSRLIFVVVYGLVLLSPVGCSRQKGSTRFQTCARCGSTRSIQKPEKSLKILYKSPGFDSCRHRWKGGVSMTVERPVADGEIAKIFSWFILE